jgi:deoxyribodipyrimidine photolyase
MKTVFEIAREAGVKENNHRFEFDMFSLERFALLVIAHNPPNSFMSFQEGVEAGRQGERARLQAFMRQMFDSYSLASDPPKEST